MITLEQLEAENRELRVAVDTQRKRINDLALQQTTLKAEVMQMSGIIADIETMAESAIDTSAKAMAASNLSVGEGLHMMAVGDSRKLMLLKDDGLFDLYDVKPGDDDYSGRFKVRGDDNYAFSIGGEFVEVTAGAGGQACDEEITVDGNTYVYLKCDRDAATVTLEAESAIPPGTDSVEYVPLWYIEVTPSLLDPRLIKYRRKDLRNCKRIDAMAG